MVWETGIVIVALLQVLLVTNFSLIQKFSSIHIWTSDKPDKHIYKFYWNDHGFPWKASFLPILL